MPRFLNTPRSAASGGETEHLPQEETQELSTIDRIGIQWLDEARWYYVKGMTFGFWGAASIWYLLIVPQDSSAVAMGFSAFAAAMVVLAVTAGCELQDAFERVQERADAATYLWQEEEAWRELERLDRENSRPLWSDREVAEAAEAVGTASATVYQFDGRPT